MTFSFFTFVFGFVFLGLIVDGSAFSPSGFEKRQFSLPLRLRRIPTTDEENVPIKANFFLPALLSAAVIFTSPIHYSQSNVDSTFFHPAPAMAIEATAVSSTLPKNVATMMTLQTPRNGRIMDLSHVLSNKDEMDILSAIAKAEAKSGTEIQVVISDQIPDGMAPKQMATALFNEWKIGPSDKNNGVLILSVLGQRRIEIEVGAGIGKTIMPSEWCTKTLEETAIPAFRQGEYGAGLSRTIDKIGNRIPSIDLSTLDQDITKTKKQPRHMVLSKDVQGTFFAVGIIVAVQVAANAQAAHQESKRRMYNQQVKRTPEEEAKIQKEREEGKVRVQKAEALGRRIRADKRKKGRLQQSGKQGRTSYNQRKQSSSTYTNNQRGYQSYSQNNYYDDTDYNNWGSWGDNSSSGNSGSDGSSSSSTDSSYDSGGGGWGSSSDDSGGSSHGDGGGADW